MRVSPRCSFWKDRQKCLLTFLTILATVYAAPCKVLAMPVLLSQRLVPPSSFMQPTNKPSAEGNFRPQFPRKSLTPVQRAKNPNKPSTPRAPFKGTKTMVSFEVFDELLPALKSAVEEISNEIGGRLEGPHSFDREEALSDAAMALGALRAAVNAIVPAGHPHYER